LEIVKKENGNLLVSPLSAQIILALTHSGCRGQTAEELRTVLHLSDDPAKIQSAVKVVLSNLKTKEGLKLCIANKMYVTRSFPIQNEFQEIAKEMYFADSENIDFTKIEQAAKTTILPLFVLVSNMEVLSGLQIARHTFKIWKKSSVVF
jgi:serpin B